MRIAVVLAVLLAACGAQEPEGSDSSPTNTETTKRTPVTGCADVIGVEIVADGDDGSFTFRVTVASSDEGWDKYANEWVVRSPDGATLGTRTLAHPHVDEQPFTRSLSDVRIPAGIASVVVAARDSVAGYCGAEFEVAVR
jgi:hypothetical protein